MGTTALAGATFLSTGACSNPSNKKAQKDRKIIHRTLGRTGLKLPVVSMGTSYAIDLVRTALEEGFVYIHTSSDYSERNHERLLGIHPASDADRGQPLVAIQVEIGARRVQRRMRAVERQVQEEGTGGLDRIRAPVYCLDGHAST